MANKQNITFFNGLKMPAIGLGTYRGGKADEMTTALEVGYRHFDTAYYYQNEKEMGIAITKWIEEGKGKREDLFIVTKLPPHGNRPSDVERFLKKSLEALQLTYVDLYLVHWAISLNNQGDDIIPPYKDGKIDLDPSTDLEAVWKEMELQVDAGRAKSIGISNFNEKQVDRIMKIARIQPANIQMEMHAYHQQRPLREVCKKHNITFCAYAPLGSPYTMAKWRESNLPVSDVPSILEEPVVKDLAAKKGKTPAQVLLRHILQLGVAVIPKSSNPKRMKENFEISDFELDDEEMKQLNDLDKGDKGRCFDFKAFLGIEAHPEYPF